MTETLLRIAIQKSGRLKEGSIKLLTESGISFGNGEQLKVRADNFPLEILFLRDDDIPQYIQDDVVDAGIVGENVLKEKQSDAVIQKRLGFARCRLSIAVPRQQAYRNITSLRNKKIATSYPVIVKNFLKKNKIDAEIHVISGSVEIAPSIGLADAVCDLVSSGRTLSSNGLREVETILNSEAVLIGKKRMTAKKQTILNKLLFRIESLQNAQSNKYILLNCPDTAIKKISGIIPGMKSPTILPLNRKGWSSLHSVVNENEFWEKIDQLKKFGAEGILVIPIEKMIS
ncbi:MAG: ATP phosphoribosyltransferase [Flammeovirgaceae bacterium]|nr:ATP phosphoribosyltransferase [Flammeovirgaceae bacterium]